MAHDTAHDPDTCAVASVLAACVLSLGNHNTACSPTRAATILMKALSRLQALDSVRVASVN